MLILSDLDSDDAQPRKSERYKTNNFERLELDKPINLKNDDDNSDFKSSRPLLSTVHSYHRNVIEAKSKRGWEDLNVAWRKSPKRAWEAVNQLWRMPDIRRRYGNFFKGGKRSKEIFVNVPVQPDNEDPTWMIDEIGYDIDFNQPVIGNDETDKTFFNRNHLKRGWEAIGPFRRRGILLPDKHTLTTGKRGWEEIAWKRNTGGMDQDIVYEKEEPIYSESNNINNKMTSFLDNNKNGQTMINLPPDIIELKTPESFDFSKGISLDEQFNLLSGIVFDRHNALENNFDDKMFPGNDNYKLDLSHDDLAQNELEGDGVLERSSIANLCAFMLRSVSRCR